MTTKTYLQLAMLPVFAVLALGSASPSKGDKTSTTETTSAPLQKVGFIGGFEWTVLDVVDRGSAMKSSPNSFPKDATTAGRFIQVHYKVTNNGKKQAFLSQRSTKLADSSGREFGPMSDDARYVPVDGQVLFATDVQPSFSKELYSIFEVPADATFLSLKVGDSETSTTRSLLLGTIPKAPATPTVAASASAPAAKVVVAKAAPPPQAAKAKAAPAKK